MLRPELTMRRSLQALLSALCMLCLLTVVQAQGVGVGTNSPAASAILDVSSDVGGVILPRMTSTARNLIDPQSAEHYGMIVYDTTRRMMYIYDYDSDYEEARWKPLDPFWIEIEPGRIAFDGVSIDASSLGELFKVQAVQHQTAAVLQTSGDGFAYPIFGLLTSVFNNTSLDKTGGRFNVWSSGSGGGRKTGVKAFASGTLGENIAVHADVQGDSAVNRAAWFERGDVVIEDRVLIGADTVYDEVHASAALELRSTTMGLLLPRMTTTQREAIPSPAEGLHVYDTDLNKTYFFNGGTWEPVEGTGGGGGSSPWNNSTHGIYYSSGNVGVGTVASADVKLSVNQQDEFTGLNLYSTSSTSNNQTGIYTYLSATGSGVKTGVLGQVYANTSSTNDVYGLRGEAHQSTSNAHVYGVYGSVTGTGNGLRWAGYFDGDVNVATQMRIGGGNFLPHESAVLELSSTDKGLLLPRMTAAQRQAISPLTHGLVVFDTDSLEAYVYGSGGWNPMGGSSSSSNLWSELAGIGVYYEESVGLGGFPFANHAATITADDEDKGLYLYQSTGGTSTKHGAHIQVSNDATGTKYGIQSEVTMHSSSTAPSYGMYSEVFQSSSSGSAVAVFGRASGSGSGLRWAGFFDGDVKIEDILHAGSVVKLNESGEYFTARSSSVGPKTTSLKPNGFGGGSIELYHGGDLLMALTGDNNGDGVLSVYDQSTVETITLNGENGRVTMKELEITGGSDMAEYFSTASTDVISPGSVVVIDADNPGSVRLSSQVSDKRVVGVVSGANGIKPGMLMGQRESIAFGDVPVAIAGRVYVKTDNSGGEIEPGDFLTTSVIAGSAMKVDEWERSRGAIIGKALTYADDDGYVLILVNLQ